MAKNGEGIGEGRYSDPDELEEEGLEESISMSAGRATLRLGAKLVRSECVEEENIKGGKKTY